MLSNVHVNFSTPPKVVQLSGERTLGTVLGGLMGYVIYDYVVQVGVRG
jgi:hypothetical protein